MPKPVYYIAISQRYLYHGDGKIHIVDGLRASKGLCKRSIFAIIENCIYEDQGHPDLCSKCHGIMDWGKVRGLQKEYMEL